MALCLRQRNEEVESRLGEEQRSRIALDAEINSLRSALASSKMDVARAHEASQRAMEAQGLSGQHLAAAAAEKFWAQERLDALARDEARLRDKVGELQTSNSGLLAEVRRLEAENVLLRGQLSGVERSTEGLRGEYADLASRLQQAQLHMQLLKDPMRGQGVLAPPPALESGAPALLARGVVPMPGTPGHMLGGAASVPGQLPTAPEPALTSPKPLPVAQGHNLEDLRDAVEGILRVRQGPSPPSMGEFHDAARSPGPATAPMVGPGTSPDAATQLARPSWLPSTFGNNTWDVAQSLGGVG